MKKPDVCLEVVSFITLLVISLVSVFGKGQPGVPYYSIGIYLFLTFVSYYPQIHNYPVKVTPENKEMLYLYSSRLVRWIKIFLLVTFMRFDGVILPPATEKPVVISAMILTLMICLYYLFKMVRKNRDIHCL